MDERQDQWLLIPLKCNCIYIYMSHSIRHAIVVNYFCNLTGFVHAHNFVPCTQSHPSHTWHGIAKHSLKEFVEEHFDQRYLQIFLTVYISALKMQTTILKCGLR